MMTLHIIAQQMSEKISVIKLSREEYLPIGKVVLLSPGEKASQPEILYVGDSETLPDALEGWDGSTVRMIITAAGATLPEKYLNMDNLQCLASDLSVRQLGNILMDEIFCFNHWLEELRGVIYRRDSQKELLNVMSDRTRCPIFWMNLGYHLLAADVNYSFEDRYIQKLLMEGYLDSYSVDSLLKNSHRLPLHIKERVNAYASTLNTGHYAILCEVWERRKFLGQFLIMTEQEEEKGALADYSRVLASFFWQYASMEKRGEISEVSSYSDLLGDLMENRIQSEAELDSRVSRLSTPMSPYYQVMSAAFDEGRGTSYSSLMKSLAEIISDSEIIRYGKDLIVFRRLKSLKSCDLDTDFIEEILKKQNAYLCIGGRSEYLSSFRAISRQTICNLHLGMGLSQKSEKRLFLSKDYHLYYVIDRCAQKTDLLDEDSLIYLCSQQYTTLYRYDQTHNSGLCDILDSYIQNNCNTSQTAKALFLHRNTLINKIAKIEEIVEGSLNDVSLRTELFFSSMVIRYIKEYSKEDPFKKMPWK